MHQSYTTAPPRQLHTTLPGPNGTRACLALYDVCPHDYHSEYRDPYLHCVLPPHPGPSQRCMPTLEYVDDRRSGIIETTRTTLSPMHESREKAVSAMFTPKVLFKEGLSTQSFREAATPRPLLPVPRPPLGDLRLMPKIYLLTFSTDRVPTTHAFAALLNKHLPRTAPLLYTIDARSFLVPPREVCERYSGVAEIVQNEVLRDARARREVEYAVQELTRRAKQGPRGTSMAMCCTAGTHRSVAVAELIALGVRREVRRMGSRDGVAVVVRHVHRVKGARDPY